MHALAGIVDARVDELVGGVQFVLGAEQLGVLGEHALAHALQRFAPGTFALRIGEALVNAGLAGLLVLQQQIGHAAVGRDDEDALVQRCAFRRPMKILSRTSSKRLIDVPPIFSTVCIFYSVRIWQAVDGPGAQLAHLSINELE